MSAAAALGVMLAYGAVTVREALEACERGTATPQQQQIVAKMAWAATEREPR